MDAQTELEIHHACYQLVTRYCHVIDHGEGSKVAELFTEDGVWASLENTMDGKAGILQGFRRAKTTRAACHATCATISFLILRARAGPRAVSTSHSTELTATRIANGQNSKAPILLANTATRS